MGNCTGRWAQNRATRNGVQWEADSEVKNCRLCGKKFGLVTRKHHCRRCGKIYCSKCCGKSHSENGTTRVCTPCSATHGQRQPPAQSAPDTYTSCPHCGERVNAAFPDGHIEVCRSNQRRRNRERGEVVVERVEEVSCGYCGEMLHPKMVRSHLEACKKGCKMNEEREKGNVEEGVGEEELCVICFEFRRNIAFEPCGHWACCSGCTIKITLCPICRTDIRGRIDVEASNINISMCPICSNHIHPTFFDGHREVCRLNKNNKSPEDNPAKPPVTKSPPLSNNLCQLCNVSPRQVASVPCGHFTMCTACSSTAASCPICFVTITSSMPLYT